MQHFYMDMSNCRHKASKEVLTKVNTSRCLNSCVWTDLCSCTLSENHLFMNGHASTTYSFSWLCCAITDISYALYIYTVQGQFLDITKICQLPGISTEQDSVYLSAIDNMHI